MEDRELLRAALQARERSYSPYSHFQVGAALLAGDGRIFTGCNIENASYSVTNCAERTAFFKAVSEGVYDFRGIAIVGGAQGQEPSALCPPCGVCRQVMMEFCIPDRFRILLGRSEEDYQVFTLAQLLPMSFGPDDLSKAERLEEDHSKGAFLGGVPSKEALSEKTYPETEQKGERAL